MCFVTNSKNKTNENGSKFYVLLVYIYPEGQYLLIFIVFLLKVILLALKTLLRHKFCAFHSFCSKIDSFLTLHFIFKMMWNNHPTWKIFIMESFQFINTKLWNLCPEKYKIKFNIKSCIFCSTLIEIIISFSSVFKNKFIKTMN